MLVYLFTSQFIFTACPLTIGQGIHSLKWRRLVSILFSIYLSSLSILEQVDILYQTLDGVLRLDGFIGVVAMTLVKVVVFCLVSSARISDMEGVSDTGLPEFYIGTLLVHFISGSV